MREQAGLTHWVAGGLPPVNYAQSMAAGTWWCGSPINDLGRKYLITAAAWFAVACTAAMAGKTACPRHPSVLRFVARGFQHGGLLLASARYQLG